MADGQADPGQLLRRLGSGVLPPGVAPPGGPHAAAPHAVVGAGDGASFQAMLDRARAGEIATGRPVELGGAPELRRDQADRLARAADLAEAHGASNALVRLDGLMLRVDVPARRVLDTVSESPGRVLDVDALVDAPGGPEGADGSPEGELPRHPIQNASLARALEAAGGHDNG